MGSEVHLLRSAGVNVVSKLCMYSRPLLLHRDLVFAWELLMIESRLTVETKGVPECKHQSGITSLSMRMDDRMTLAAATCAGKRLIICQ